MLITDYDGQVRFYEAPGKYQEIYSFYTPSQQTGLLMADVDGDRLPDLFCGNYWIRSPAKFQLPWRLFAINIRHEQPRSASMRLVLRGRELFAAQGHLEDGSLFKYTPGEEPRQLWKEQLLATGLHQPHAMAGGAGGLVIGENNGPGSRLFEVRDGEHLEQIAVTAGVHTAFIAGGRILTVGANEIRWWNPQRRR